MNITSFLYGLAFSLSLFSALASSALAESAGDPCQLPTVGRVYTVEGPNGPSLVCNGTTLDVYESVSGGPTRKGIATASPKTTFDVNGELKFGTTGIACDADRKGAVRYDSAGLEEIEMCDGVSWDGLRNSTAISSLNAATRTNAINNATFQQSWGWQFTSAGIGLTLGEYAASTGGFFNQFILAVSTEPGSTAIPLAISNEGASYAFIVVKDENLGDIQFVIDGDGKVGIETGEPKTTLDVNGEVKFNYTGIGCDGDREGAIRYDSAGGTPWEYCNGSAWVPFESAGLTGPAGCSDIGDLCADGTVFAGYHPITQEHLFIPPTDQERPGSPGTYTMNWKNAIGTNDISTDSTADGKVNHANRGGAIGNFQAFQACEDLSFGAHTDWYLPSRVEAYYLWSVHETIEAGGNITNFQNAAYWSSTEYGTNGAWVQSFYDGLQTSSDKTDGYRVRCVRR